MALDERRGLVYAATGSASYDFYGANRHGDNLFANSILCLRAATGERVWHFQAVKHDLWDRDFPAPPSLVTIDEGRPPRGRRRADREERPAVRARPRDRAAGLPDAGGRRPASDVPGERAATRQLLPTLPPPFTRQRFTGGPDHRRARPRRRKAVRARWEQLRKGGEFDPPSLQGTVLFPGMDGGGEWGGTAYDPGSGLLYVNANEMAWVVKLAERKLPDGAPVSGQHALPALLRVVPPRGPARQPAGVPLARGHRRARRNVDEIARRRARGRRPHARLRAAARRGAPRDRPVRRERAASETVRADAPSPFDVRYTLDGDIRFTDPDGFPGRSGRPGAR